MAAVLKSGPCNSIAVWPLQLPGHTFYYPLFLTHSKFQPAQQHVAMEIYSNWEFATKYNISHSWSHKDKECRIEIKVWLTSIPQSSGFFRFSVFKDDNIIMGSPPLPQPYLGYLIIPVYGICKSLYFFKEIITWMWMKWQYGKWPLQMSGPCTLTSSHVFLFGYFVQMCKTAFLPTSAMKREYWM